MKPMHPSAARSPLTVVAAAALWVCVQAGAQAQTALDEGTTFNPVVSDSSTRAGSSQILAPLVAANAQVGAISLEVEQSNSLRADGNSHANIKVFVLDRRGQPMRDEVVLTLQVSGRARLMLQGAATDETGPGYKDEDRRTPGIQLRVAGGQAQFSVIAPPAPEDVRVHASVGAAEVQTVLAFKPELREMLAVGVVEGVLRAQRRDYDSAVTPARMDDGFEQELRHWSRSLGSNTKAAVQAAMFLKGKVRGDWLLTLAYDSEKETRARLLRDIRPEQYYPVYGDASTKIYDAQSSSKLYVRLDKDRHYILWGDFRTDEGYTPGPMVSSQLTTPMPGMPMQGAAGIASMTSQNVLTAPVPMLPTTGLVVGTALRQLGSYQRTATGVRAHWETAQARANVFASRDTLHQVVEELRANGTSGPFAVSNTTALENSERVEVIVRDRNNLGVVLSVTPMVRLNDYSFEPFSGRILLARPLPSLDANGNPMSLRIVYEVDQGGQAFWLVGLDGQMNLTPRLTVGGSAVVDDNPLTPFKLASAHAGAKLGEHTRLVVEVAATDAVPTLGTSGVSVSTTTSAGSTLGATQVGRAARVELLHEDQQLQARLVAMRAGASFANPAAGAMPGSQAAGLSVNWRASEQVRLGVDAQHVQDTASDARRDGASLALTWQPVKTLELSAGLRHARENGRVAGLFAGIGANPAPGSAFASGQSGGFSGASDSTMLNLNGAGSLGSTLGSSAPGTTSDLSANTAVLSGRWQPTQKLGLMASAETGLTNSDQRRYAVGAGYQIAERARVYLRAERQSALASVYSLDSAERSSSLSLGLDSGYDSGAAGSGNVFSEYRLRDAMGDPSAMFSTGLRHTVQVAQGLALSGSAEQLRSVQGPAQSAHAATLGLDYTGSPLWMASARLEWRRLNQGATATTAATTSASTTANTTAVLNQDTWLSTLSLARKLDRDWTALARNYRLSTDNHGTRPDGWQNRLQLGLAWRPVDHNRYDVLGKLEQKDEHNINGLDEWRRASIAALHVNWHPSRPWWLSTRLAAKSVDEQFPSTEGGGQSSYRAALVGARLIYDISEHWDLGLMGSLMRGSGGATQRAIGAEAGYLLQSNLWLGVGYNATGFTDRDLGSDYTARGWYLRLRFKFGQDLFESDNPKVNPALLRP